MSNFCSVAQESCLAPKGRVLLPTRSLHTVSSVYLPTSPKIARQVLSFLQLWNCKPAVEENWKAFQDQTLQMVLRNSLTTGILWGKIITWKYQDGSRRVKICPWLKEDCLLDFNSAFISQSSRISHRACKNYFIHLKYIHRKSNACFLSCSWKEMTLTASGRY